MVHMGCELPGSSSLILAVASVAAYISYWQAYAVVREFGDSGATAQLEPALIEGLAYASSTVSYELLAWIIRTTAGGPDHARERSW